MDRAGCDLSQAEDSTAKMKNLLFRHPDPNQAHIVCD